MVRRGSDINRRIAQAVPSRKLSCCRYGIGHPMAPVYLWMRDTRNGMTHRAGAKRITTMTKDGRFVRLFYRQPRWSELQSMVFGARPPKKPLFDAFILSASEDILDGLCESMGKFVEAVVAAMGACWAERRADPSLIVQHGRQWRLRDPSESMSNFPGYGLAVVPDARQLRISPSSGRRWAAGRVLDDRRADWYA